MITNDYIIEIALQDHLRFIMAAKDHIPDECLTCLYASDTTEFEKISIFYMIKTSEEILIMLSLRFPIKIFDDNV